MRALLGGLLVFLLGGAPLRAQSVQLGVKAGGSVATLVGPGTHSPPTIRPLLGAVGGLYRTVALGPAGHWALQAELLYAQQGYRLSNASTQYEATLRSNYVSLPVLLTYAHRGFFGEVGPQVSYLASVREEYRVVVPGVVGRAKRVTTDPRGLPRWDGAAVAGAGYRWATGWGVEARGTASFTGAYDIDRRRSNARPRHAGVQVLVSVPLLQ